MVHSLEPQAMVLRLTNLMNLVELQLDYCSNLKLATSVFDVMKTMQQSNTATLFGDSTGGLLHVLKQKLGENKMFTLF